MRRIGTLLAIFALTLCIFSPLRALCQEKPATSNWEVYFSPKGGCTDSIIRELNNAKHAIAHNKVMIIDGEIVITGSFNFTIGCRGKEC